MMFSIIHSQKISRCSMFTNNIEKPATHHPIKILPSEVHSVLSSHMLADGFAIVFDLEKSHGTYVYDSRTNRTLLDYFTFFASGALGMNHPKLRNHHLLKSWEKLLSTSRRTPMRIRWNWQNLSKHLLAWHNRRTCPTLSSLMAVRWEMKMP